MSQKVKNTEIRTAIIDVLIEAKGEAVTFTNLFEWSMLRLGENRRKETKSAIYEMACAGHINRRAITSRYSVFELNSNSRAYRAQINSEEYNPDESDKEPSLQSIFYPKPPEFAVTCRRIYNLGAGDAIPCKDAQSMPNSNRMGAWQC